MTKALFQVGVGLGVGEGVGVGVGVVVGMAVGATVAEGVAGGVVVGGIDVGLLKTPVAFPGIIWISLAMMPLAPGSPTAAILWPTARLAEEVACDLNLIIVSGVRIMVYLELVFFW